MPVYIHQDDALERMGAVEQDERWEQQQRDGSFGHACLFSSFRDEWERAWRDADGPADALYRLGLTVDGNGAIYGSGGFNRYTVRGSGEILFIEAQARSDADVRRAVEQGFRLFPAGGPP